MLTPLEREMLEILKPFAAWAERFEMRLGNVPRHGVFYAASYKRDSGEIVELELTVEHIQDARDVIARAEAKERETAQELAALAEAGMMPLSEYVNGVCPPDSPWQPPKNVGPDDGSYLR